MTISVAHRGSHASTGLFARVKEAVARKITEIRVYAQTRSELEAMSDRDLADLGITRFMIEDIALDAARRA